MVWLSYPSLCNTSSHSEIIKLSTFKARYALRNESTSTDKSINCFGPWLAPHLVLQACLRAFTFLRCQGNSQQVPAIWNRTDFLFHYVQLSWTKLFEASTMWNLEAACSLCSRKSIAFLIIHEKSRTSTAPSCLPYKWCKWEGVVYTYCYSTDRDLPLKTRLALLLSAYAHPRQYIGYASTACAPYIGASCPKC